MDSKRIEHVLKHDFSAGTERFREELLHRCLDLIRASGGRVLKRPSGGKTTRAAGDADEEQSDCREVDDSVLNMLAAAGSTCRSPHEGPKEDLGLPFL